MTYSTVMVHLDLYQSNDARLRVAGEFAEQFKAKLIGIAGCQPQPVVYADGSFAHGLVEKLRAEAEEKLSALQAVSSPPVKAGSRMWNGARRSYRRSISWRARPARPIW
jgi:hypothetical protein